MLVRSDAVAPGRRHSERVSGFTQRGRCHTQRGHLDTEQRAELYRSSIAGAFPTSIDGMTVQTVAQARALLDAGQINGRAVAVGGYFFETFPACPYPGGYVGPLDDWCRIVAFTDTEESAQLCHYSSCTFTAQGVPSLAPFFMPETIGVGAATNRPWNTVIPVVLIGHARDPRAWQCWPDATQQECTMAFVVDRVAWANGQEVPVTAPEPYDYQTGAALSPNLSLDDVTQALAAENRVLAAGAFRARDIWTIDPRLNLAGDGLVWLVRTLSPIADSADAARAVDVSVIDDATAGVLDTIDLDDGSDYAPGRLWMEAMRDPDAQGNAPDDMRPFLEVETTASVVLHQGLVSGGASGTLRTLTYGPGSPVVLDPGTYSVSSWLATFDGGQMGQRVDECSTQITIAASQDSWLAADFRGSKSSCTFQPFTPPEPG
jgi:hypothetical protein